MGGRPNLAPQIPYLARGTILMGFAVYETWGQPGASPGDIWEWSPPIGTVRLYFIMGFAVYETWGQPGASPGDIWKWSPPIGTVWLYVYC